MDNIADASGAQDKAARALGRPTKVRIFMLSLVLIATIINYIDRVNISVAAPFMTKDLGIDKVQMGFMFSAFAWTYAFALIPGGYAADRYGSRIAYGASLAFWSLQRPYRGSPADLPRSLARGSRSARWKHRPFPPMRAP